MQGRAPIWCAALSLGREINHSVKRLTFHWSVVSVRAKPISPAGAAMTRLLYDLEDYLEDASHAERLPGWIRRIAGSIGRTIGETGDLLVWRRGWL